MTTNNPLPAHLERIGAQLITAAEGLHAPGSSGSRQLAQPRRAFAMLARAPRLAAASSLASLAAVAAVAAILATTGTTPAYALTQNANGTYTITINDIATGVPALNTKLQQLGIDATAVPVTNTCTAPSSSLTERTEMQLSPTLATDGSGGLINLDQANIPAGTEGVIAAYQSPSGQINLTFWTTSGSAPSCLNTGEVVPSAPATSTQP
jgi:hypothetical protein